jgi:hypothetical protein
MQYYYQDQLTVTKYLYAALLCLFIAALLLASGALQVNDNGFVLSIGKFLMSYGG